jgi:hypothetical protein
MDGDIKLQYSIANALQLRFSLSHSALGQNTFEIIKYAQVIILCIHIFMHS